MHKVYLSSSGVSKAVEVLNSETHQSTQQLTNGSTCLTLTGHACWLIARLADAVTGGGAAGLGGVLGVRAGQAGAQTSWCSLRFVGGRWTCW